MAGAEGPTAAGSETGLELSRGGFDFAFNSQNFSDRVLRLEIVAGGSSGNEIAGGSLAGSKRRRNEEVLRVKTMYINSAILASRSPFFLKLFSNGMKESDQPHPTLRIADSDENAIMELLSFIYSGKLTTTEPTLLLDILMAADKFEVVSCMRHCCQLLASLPLTTESALLYLDHPCSMSMAPEVQILKGAAKEFLANECKDYNKFQQEVMNISLAGIEAILSSSDLHVVSEDYLYYLLLKWARVRYPELEERRYSLRGPEARGMLPTLPSQQIVSRPFHVAGQGFVLGARCNKAEQGGLYRFGVFVCTDRKLKGSTHVTLDCEFASRTRTSLQFVSMLNSKYTLKDELAFGCDDLFLTPWSTFLDDDSPFFVDGVLCLRVDLRVVEQTEQS